MTNLWLKSTRAIQLQQSSKKETTLDIIMLRMAVELGKPRWCLDLPCRVLIVFEKLGSWMKSIWIKVSLWLVSSFARSTLELHWITTGIYITWLLLADRKFFGLVYGHETIRGFANDTRQISTQISPDELLVSSVTSRLCDISRLPKNLP